MFRHLRLIMKFPLRLEALPLEKAKWLGFNDMGKSEKRGFYMYMIVFIIYVYEREIPIHVYMLTDIFVFLSYKCLNAILLALVQVPGRTSLYL